MRVETRASQQHVKGGEDNSTEYSLVFATWRKIPEGDWVCHCRCMRRDNICLYLGPVGREQLMALCANRNTPGKVVWRAEIVLATADGCGTSEIMRRADTSKLTV